VGQAECLSQLDRFGTGRVPVPDGQVWYKHMVQARCLYQTCPTGTGKGKKRPFPCPRDRSYTHAGGLSLSEGQALYPRWRHVPVLGQALHPRWSMSPSNKDFFGAASFPGTERICGNPSLFAGIAMIFLVIPRRMSASHDVVSLHEVNADDREQTRLHTSTTEHLQH